MRYPRLFFFAAFACASAFVPSAHANEKSVCAAASEDAQRLQKMGKLLGAREKLLVCTRPVCPAIVKQDCDAWLSTLDAVLPSLVVAAHDEDGHDVLGTAITLDGSAIDASSGRALPVDPGVHVLHVEAPGKIPVDQKVVVQEGERARPVAITLVAKDKPKPPPPPPPPPPVILPAPHETSPLVYVLGTLGAVSVASFAVFEIKAVSDSTHLRNTCAPRCAQSDVDQVSTETVAANVSLALGAAFAAGAVTVWWLGRPHAAATALELGPGRVGVRGSF